MLSDAELNNKSAGTKRHLFCLSGHAQDVGDPQYQYLRATYTASVLPLLLTAGLDEQSLKIAYIQFNSWELSLGIYAPPFAVDVENSRQMLGDASMQNLSMAKNLCYTNRDLSYYQQMRRILEWVESKPLIFIHAPAIREVTKDYINKCVRFKLEMESEITHQGDDGEIKANVETQINLTINNPYGDISDIYELSGEGRTNYISLDWPAPSGSDCTVIPTLIGAEANVSLMEIRLDLSTIGTNFRDIEMRFAPGAVSEVLTLYCGSHTVPLPIKGYWIGQWFLLHQYEDYQNGSISIEEWMPSPALDYAEKNYSVTSENGSHEEASFRLIHDPQM